MTSLILLAFQRERGGLVCAHVECRWDTENIFQLQTELQHQFHQLSKMLNFDIKV